MYNSFHNYHVTVWRDSIGTEKLRIGELAEIAKVTKRTIDHYTNLGLLKVERSTSNYRYYDKSAIERLHFIEKCKKDGMSLEKIKETVVEKDAEEIDVLELRLKIQGLEKEVTDVLAHLDQKDLKNIKKNVSNESLSLIQTLLLLIH
ncbi:MerR family transcriptional regulator [Robertmurraya korlensis]|uniref:MerR family transcriptional regulator n=1 Tax=Robertmurraya korlensis TaxID=519977 RepID=UPI000B197BD2|nr:MerR family transcriptional regulator [Robertmurraya korlensis]